MTVELLVNGTPHSSDADPDMPLLWYLRDILGLMGTKYSCGEGVCGTCTVLVDGDAKRACVFTLQSAAGKSITTIEGLGQDTLHKVQQAFIKHNAAQCGYCMPGQIMTAAALFDNADKPDKNEIDTTMDGVLCRCGSYQRIRNALYELAEVA